MFVLFHLRDISNAGHLPFCGLFFALLFWYFHTSKRSEYSTDMFDIYACYCIFGVRGWDCWVYRWVYCLPLSLLSTAESTVYRWVYRWVYWLPLSLLSTAESTVYRWVYCLPLSLPRGVSLLKLIDFVVVNKNNRFQRRLLSVSRLNNRIVCVRLHRPSGGLISACLPRLPWR